MTVDEKIKTELNIQEEKTVDIYKNSVYRNECSKKVAKIVQEYKSNIDSEHDQSLEEQLLKNGCVVLENFFSEEEVESVLNLIKDEPGYNNHIAATAYNKEPKVFGPDLDWNILSYTPDILFKSDVILKKFTDTKFLSLIQSYLGCFPTLYSINCVWSKFNGSEYRTQLVHRDYDDFKFLAFFVILTDIDDNNGPHIFYPNTQNGEEISPDHKPVVVKGKRGTAFLADTFAFHNGVPLLEGQRCLLWVRYGQYINNIHFKDKNNEFPQDKSQIFKHIDENENNQYLLRAFLQTS